MSLMLSLAMCCVAASCSDDDPKPVPEPVPDVPDVPKPSEPVGHDAAITAYFNDVLEGNEAQLPDLTEMTMDDADAMASHVWDLYAEAVKAKETALPTPFDLVAKWNAYEYAYSGTMKLTNGEDMQYAYAYKGSRPSSGWPMFTGLCLLAFTAQMMILKLNSRLPLIGMPITRIAPVCISFLRVPKVAPVAAGFSPRVRKPGSVCSALPT